MALALPGGSGRPRCSGARAAPQSSSAGRRGLDARSRDAARCRASDCESNRDRAVDAAIRRERLRRAIHRRRIAAILCGTPIAVAAASLRSDRPAGAAAGSRGNQAHRVRVAALNGSVPQRGLLSSGFIKWCGDRRARVDLTLKRDVASVYRELSAGSDARRGRGSAINHDLATLGDAWLAPAVRGGLIAPLVGAESSAWWPALPEACRRVVTRDASGAMRASMPDAPCFVWGAPYRVHALAVMYRTDRVKAPIRRWEDLLRDDLRQRVALPASPALWLALASKIATGRFNLEPEAAPASKRAGSFPPSHTATVGSAGDGWAAATRALRTQARTTGTSDGLRALEASDVDAIVGWSSLLVPRSRRCVAPCHISLPSPLSPCPFLCPLACPYPPFPPPFPCERGRRTSDTFLPPRSRHLKVWRGEDGGQGTLLSADVWVAPASRPPAPGAASFLEYAVETGGAGATMPAGTFSPLDTQALLHGEFAEPVGAGIIADMRARLLL